MTANMPYMPVWQWDRPPPLVFIGKSPPGAVRWLGVAASPLPKPSLEREQDG